MKRQAKVQKLNNRRAQRAFVRLMKRAAIAAIVAAQAACATAPAPLLRPGEQIVIGSEPSRFDSFSTRKPQQSVSVRTEKRADLSGLIIVGRVR